MIDLISSAVGGRIVEFNDEFFAAASNLISPAEPVSNSDYTDRGKWMDGWETRRRREPGNDWCVVALGVPGRIEQVTVDTSFFTGNYPESFSLDGCGDGRRRPARATPTGRKCCPKTPLSGDSRATFVVDNPHRFGYVRLNIFPDGGVARLRVEGTPIPSRSQVCSGTGTGRPAVDAGRRGGRECLGCPLLPAFQSAPPHRAGGDVGRLGDQADEGAPGNDWVELKLGMPGTIETVVDRHPSFQGQRPGVGLDPRIRGRSWLGRRSWTGSRSVPMTWLDSRVAGPAPRRLSPGRHPSRRWSGPGQGTGSPRSRCRD